MAAATAFRLTAPAPREQELHETIATAFTRMLAPPVEWAFYPAGAIQLTGQQVAKLVRMGLKRGWPDFIVIHQGGIYGLEVKRAGGQLSATHIGRTKRGAPRVLIGQRDMFPRLIEAGFRDIQVVRSLEGAIAALDEWKVPMRGRISA